MIERYFMGEVSVWNGDDECVDGFNVIFENKYRRGILRWIHCGYDVPYCFINAINARLNTENWCFDYNGDGYSFACIYL
ncbi:MAG: hypothetical protein ACTSRI_02625 [Promethearchaeota archaeon]